MLRKFTTSYDELIRNYYGDSSRARSTDRVTVEELFANYYGNASVAAEERKKTQLPKVMSLSHDSGELLPQRRRRQGGQYGYQQSVDPSEFEEYVVGSDVAVAQSVAAAMSVDTPQVERPDVREEYTIDILAPLQGSSAASDRTTSENNRAAA